MVCVRACLCTRMGVPPWPSPCVPAVLDSIYSGYGESMPRGKGPTQGRIRSEGNKYLQQFPLLDWVLRAYVEWADLPAGPLLGVGPLQQYSYGRTQPSCCFPQELQVSLPGREQE